VPLMQKRVATQKVSHEKQRAMTPTNNACSGR
jgi:hypothetical protein